MIYKQRGETLTMPGSMNLDRLTLYCTPAEAQRIRIAAAKEGTTVSKWLRRVALAAVKAQPKTQS